MDWRKSSFGFVAASYGKPHRKFLATSVSVFQGQESCSELNNFHVSGLFYNSTPPSSTSQPYCGRRTLILQKCTSETVIHRVHSLVHRCFLMGTMGDQSPLGKEKWTEGSHSPSCSQYQHLFLTLSWSLKTIWFSR